MIPAFCRVSFAGGQPIPELAVPLALRHWPQRTNWEISIKTTLGKLSADPNEILEALRPAGLSLLPIMGDHAAKVATLPQRHKDPSALAGYSDLVRVV